MPIRVTCPKCGKKYKVRDELTGKTVKCRICSGRIGVPEVNEAQIIRHEARMRDFELAIGDEQNIEAISQHIESHLGRVDSVLHEMISDLVHIDVHVVKPNEDRPWVTLVTSGMSDRPMTVSEGAEDWRFAEMLITLPAEWPLEQSDWSDENHYWPIRWLKQLARLPHEYETWLGPCHTVPNGDPPEPLAENTAFCGFIVLPPVSTAEEFQTLHLDGGRQIHFLSLVPLYLEEMNFKISRGAEALLDRFSQFDVGDVVDLERPNVCSRR